MAQKLLSVPRTLNEITKPWSPHLVARLDNAYDVKVAKLDGEFIFHSHEDADELFYILSGALEMQILGDGGVETVELKAGDVFVVPKGVKHKPVAKDKAEVMLIEKVGVVNTGDGESVDGLTNQVKDARSNQ